MSNNSDKRLKRHIDDLQEANRTAQLYYKEEQWVLLERANKTISDITNMIKVNLEENERMVPIDG